MSTATQPVVDLPVVRENFTYSLVEVPTGKKDEQGNDINEYEVKTESAAQDFEKEGKGKILATQSFSIPRANTFAGIQEVCPNEKEAAKLFSNGLTVKLQNKARALLQAKDEDGNFTFEVTAEAHDLSQYAPVETATRGMSALEKIKKMLVNVPPDQQAQLIALLQQQQATTE